MTLAWIPALPLAGYLLLALRPPGTPRRAIAWIGVGSVALSCVATLVLAARFLASTLPGGAWTEVLWTWFDVDGFRPAIALRLDALSLVMAVVVTFVGFLIHLYSAGFMADDDGYGRFFAYMNLFVASMATLVLADDLLLLYLGWEGVGLCSYLLIGFWYRDAANGLAARKAFIVTRVGDAAMALGLFLLATRLGTLSIQELMARASSHWPVGAPVAAWAAALLLVGALGKSAQLPLQTWLPDAMAGPTPTSALIHAATMVTAGVYLVARTHVLFDLAPAVRTAVAVIGAATLLMAGASAAVQRDIKRVLAYSTMSQIGYMFLALGVGAWAAALFHFMTHAFFKALLFMSAGIVIEALHHEHDVFRMGGLRSRLPVAFWTFLAGAAALAGLPLVTAGFFSKDLILWNAWSSAHGGTWPWLAGTVGVLLTAYYTTRMITLVFFGEPKGEIAKRPGPSETIPVVVLAALSIVAGWIELPPWLGDRPAFTRWISAALPLPPSREGTALSEAGSALVATLALAAGLALAWWLFARRRELVDRASTSPLGAALRRFWFADWGFDWLYDRALVRPFVALAHADRGDVVDLVYTGLAAFASWLHRLLGETETGHLRWYAAGIAFGSVLLLAVALLR